ncbi:MAG: glycosyltransferase family 2 protein [Eubacterium sp.]|nr:glycosyltransferase family 2 protein [Eubacterium sp.]
MFEGTEKKQIYELTILMPCRNEERAVVSCVERAADYLKKRGIRGEILVVDNGSTDRSAELAVSHGARVVHVRKPGYGRALRGGMKAARGRVIVMADCDTTYDFYETDKLYGPLAKGSYDLMIGDRFSGGIERGAMPISHRIGGKFLSWLARKRFRTKIRDFHCGFRGITKEAWERINIDLTAAGMEFATEMIAVAARDNLRIGQTPVRLKRCRVRRRSKLRIVRDGFRHLRYILK